MKKQEKNLAIKVARIIKGCSQPISNQEIRRVMMKLYDIELTDAQVRALIKIIRMNNYIRNLCAGHSGYYIEKDTTKVLNYIKGYELRAKSMLSVVATMRRNCLRNAR